MSRNYALWAILSVLIIVTSVAAADAQDYGNVYFPTEKGTITKYRTYDDAGKMTGFETNSVNRTYYRGDTLYVDYTVTRFSINYKIQGSESKRIYFLNGRTCFGVNMLEDYDTDKKTRKRIAELKKMGASVSLVTEPVFDVDYRWQVGDMLPEVAYSLQLSTTGVAAVKLSFADRKVEAMERYTLDSGKKILCMKISYTVRYEMGDGYRKDVGTQTDLYAPGVGLVRREGTIDWEGKKSIKRVELSSVAD